MRSRGLWVVAVSLAVSLLGCGGGGHSAGQSPQPSHPATAAPLAHVAAVAARPRVPLLAACGRPSYKPRGAGMYCADGGVFLDRMHWLSWGHRSAVAKAVVSVQGDPSGHGGAHYKARVTFWRPIRINSTLALFSCATFNPAWPT